MARGVWLQLALLYCLSLSGQCQNETEEGGGEGHGEAEEHTPKADVMVAAMLLASVTYMMFTLGMANQRKDRAMKKLTWTALHTKISIFCAVLMYQAVVGVFVQHEEESANGTLKKIITSGFGWFFWFFSLQALMASLSFEMFSKKMWMKPTPSTRVLIHVGLHRAVEEETDDEWEERREVLMEFWGVLMGHITGFASIVFWAQSQLGWQTAQHTRGAFMIIGIAIFAQLAWFLLVKKARAWIVLTYDPNAAAGHASKAARKALDRWNEKTEETENDSMALTLSFMFVQAFRVLVSGVMPDPEGLEERGGPAGTGPLAETHTFAQSAQLVFCGVVLFAAVIVWRDSKHLACIKDPIQECCENWGINFERINEVASDTGSMVLAWTLFFAVYWVLDTFNRDVCSSFHGVNCGSGGMTGGILLAMCTTIMSYSTIFAFRRTALHIDDFSFPSHHQQKTAHDIILSVMKAQGLLIGFGWEKAFDKAVEDLSENASHPGLTRFVMSTWVFAVVGYIWMWYILPTVMEYQEDDETKSEYKAKFKVKDQSIQLLINRQELRISNAKDEFEEELTRMQTEYEEAARTTSEHMRKLRDKEYVDLYDAQGRHINSGTSRADHLNHMRHLLNLQKEAAEYQIVGGDLFRQQRTNAVM